MIFLPRIFQNYFSYINESLHGLMSDGPQKLCIPNINSVRFGKGSIPYFCPVIWNSIPPDIRNANTLLRKKKSKMEAIKLSMSTLCRFWVELVLQILENNGL